MPEGFLPFLKTADRCFDRAVIYSPSIAGEALQQFIAAALNREIQQPGREMTIETTHLCRWGGALSVFDWWSPKPDADVLRGLMILDRELIGHSQLLPLMTAALQECQIAQFS